MLKWPPVMESWLYLDPARHGDPLMARSTRITHRDLTPAPLASSRPGRDRYYTMARRFHVIKAMKGQR